MRGRGYGQLVALLHRPAAPLMAAFVGVLLTLPSIGGGLFADDYLQRSVLLGVGDVGSDASPAFDMFSFVPQGPRRDAAMAMGVLGWWADPNISVALFRPLAAFSHVLDTWLWPGAIFAHHLQNLLWYALAIAAVGALYRQVEGATAVAGLAALLFAVDDAHAMCAGWLANRHALIALVFGVVALLAHVRWRRDEDSVWFVAAAGAFTLSLLCGEAALGAAAYLFAWELTMANGSWSRRVGALLPYGLLISAWRLLYERFGYGTTGTALYVDPGHNPLGFLSVLVERWPVLQLAHWANVPVDLYVLFPRAVQIGLFVSGLAACAGLVWLLGPLLAERRSARFWAAGMCLSLVPLCAAFPMDRLLLFAGVGGFALLAALVERVGLLRFRDASGVLGGRRTVAAILLVLHGPAAAILLVGRVAVLPWLGGFADLAARTAPADTETPKQTYVFVGGHEFPVVYLPIIRQLEAPQTSPQRVAMLASMFEYKDIYREDDETLVIEPSGGFLRDSADRLLRSMEHPFRVGERIARPDFIAEVRAVTADGRPARVAFRFREPLESRRYRWLLLGGAGTLEFALPAVGERVEIAPVSFWSLLAG
jgi:hypothetical protein